MKVHRFIVPMLLVLATLIGTAAAFTDLALAAPRVLRLEALSRISTHPRDGSVRTLPGRNPQISRGIGEHLDRGSERFATRICSQTIGIERSALLPCKR